MMMIIQIDNGKGHEIEFAKHSPVLQATCPYCTDSLSQHNSVPETTEKLPSGVGLCSPGRNAGRQAKNFSARPFLKGGRRRKLGPALSGFEPPIFEEGNCKGADKIHSFTLCPMPPSTTSAAVQKKAFPQQTHRLPTSAGE